jgi:hypothetical protein
VTLSFEGGVTADWIGGRIESAIDLVARTNRNRKAT